MHRFVYKFLLTKFFKFIDNLFFCNGQTFVCDFKGPLMDKFSYGQTHFCLPMDKAENKGLADIKITTDRAEES